MFVDYNGHGHESRAVEAKSGKADSTVKDALESVVQEESGVVIKTKDNGEDFKYRIVKRFCG